MKNMPITQTSRAIASPLPLPKVIPLATRGATKFCCSCSLMKKRSKRSRLKNRLLPTRLRPALVAFYARSGSSRT